MSHPTSRQLQYLRSLADRTGRTFTYPKTGAQASAEIQRLKGTTPQSTGERRYERKLIADQVATGLNNTAVHADETTGYGSDAAWRQHRPPQEQIVSSHRPTPRKTTPAASCSTYDRWLTGPARRSPTRRPRRRPPPRSSG